MAAQRGCVSVSGCSLSDAGLDLRAAILPGCIPLLLCLWRNGEHEPDPVHAAAIAGCSNHIQHVGVCCHLALCARCRVGATVFDVPA